MRIKRKALLRPGRISLGRQFLAGIKPEMDNPVHLYNISQVRGWCEILEQHNEIYVII